MDGIALETLERAPSWCKVDPRTGRVTAVDRSACLEVRLSEVRRLAGCVVVNARTGKRRSKAGVAALPGERACGNGQGRLATGVFEVTARMLAWLGSRRPRRRLRGDYRGTRANAMRPVDWTPGEGGLPVGLGMVDIRHKRTWKGHRQRTSFGRRGRGGVRLPENVPIEQVLLDNVLPGNPNRVGPFDIKALDAAEREREVVAHGGGGDSERKVLGLPAGWRQPLRIEKWQIRQGRPPSYYLVCPGCGRGASEWIEPEHRADHRLPGLSRLGRGDNARASNRSGCCPHRVLFLLLPLCTAGEWRDAQIAWTWLASLPRHQRMLPAAQQVAARYAPLLPTRTLLCRHCLGVSYGNHPEPVRLGYHRRKAQARARAAESAVGGRGEG